MSQVATSISGNNQQIREAQNEIEQLRRNEIVYGDARITGFTAINDVTDELRWEKDKQRFHAIAGTLGIIPGAGEPFDFIDGTVYALEGKYGDAALSYGSMVPIGGYIANARRAEKLIQNQLFKNALKIYKNSDLTQAGRALTKHPEVLGYTKQNIRQSLRTDQQINQAASDALKSIMRNGIRTIEYAPKAGENVIQYRLPNGFGARFKMDGSFQTFIEP